MTKAKSGDTVSVDYTLSTSGGNILDTSAGRPPIRFILGSGEVIPGLDQAVLGMSLGESKTVLIPPALAHGHHRPERVLHFKRDAVPFETRAHSLQMRSDLFTTTESADLIVTEDYNHPLAGKELTFEITLVSIEALSN